MKLSALRYFVTIAKYHSFTKASESLFISQPTLSRTIMELEEELGTKLFHREKNNLHLTPNGKTLYKEASEILERCDILSVMFRTGEQESPEDTVIRIGYQTNLNIQHVYPVLNSFMKENGGCKVIVEQASTPQLKTGLEENRYDMLLALDSDFMQRIINSQNASSAIIGQSHLQVVFPENSNLDADGEIGLMELEDQNFILIHRKHAPESVDRLIA